MVLCNVNGEACGSRKSQLWVCRKNWSWEKEGEREDRGRIAPLCSSFPPREGPPCLSNGPAATLYVLQVAQPLDTREQPGPRYPTAAAANRCDVLRSGGSLGRGQPLVVVG